MTGVVEAGLLAAGASAATAASAAGAVATAGSVAGVVSSLASAGLAISGAMSQRADTQMQAWNAGLQAQLTDAQAQAQSVQAGFLRTQAGLQDMQAGLQDNEATGLGYAAQAEALRGRQEANQVREALLRTLASNTARFGAAGIMLGEGSVQTVEDDARRAAEVELSIGGANSAQRAAALRIQQAGTQAQAIATRMGAGTTRANAAMTESEAAGSRIRAVQGGMQAGLLMDRADTLVPMAAGQGAVGILDSVGRFYGRREGTTPANRRDA